MEDLARTTTVFISHGLEIVAALMIAAALLKLIIDYCRSLVILKGSLLAVQARMNFGSAVAVALELLLGADVLATAVAPSWDDVGKLVAIATLRTGLNYFLEKELKHYKSVH